MKRRRKREYDQITSDYLYLFSLFLVLVVFCHLGWVAIIGDSVNEEFNIGCSAQQILLLLLNSEQRL